MSSRAFARAGSYSSVGLFSSTYPAMPGAIGESAFTAWYL